MIENENRKYIDWLITIIPILLFGCVVFLKYPIVYQTVDDRFIMSFLSGKFTGNPDAHVVYMMYPFAYIIKIIYSCFPHYDWYGTLMLMLQFVMLFVCSFCLVKKMKTVKKKVFTLICLYAIYIFVWFEEIVMFTYTTVAASIASTLVIVYLVMDEGKCKNVIMVLLSFGAYNIRKELFYMVLPVCGIIWLYKFKKNKKEQIVIFLSIILVISGSYGIDRIAYSSEEWQDYLSYNRIRTEIYDYHYSDLFYDYSSNINMWKEIGITEAQWQALKNRNISLYGETLYNKICLIKNYKEKTVISKIECSIKTLYREVICSKTPIVIFIAIMCILLIVRTVLEKDNKLIIRNTLLILLQLVLWFYLAYKGRLLSRVIQSYLVSELALVIGLHVELKEFNCSSNKLKRLLFTVFGMVILYFTISDIHICKELYYDNKCVKDDNEYNKLEKYYNKNNSKIYFVDVQSMSDCRYVYHFNNDNDYENYLSLGNWFGNNPLYREKLNIMRISDIQKTILENKNVRIMATEDADISYIEKISSNGVEIIEDDRITCRNRKYIIYSLIDKSN